MRRSDLRQRRIDLPSARDGQFAPSPEQPGAGAFVLGLTVFGETLRPAQLASFVLIRAALALFSGDLWRRRAGSAKPPA